MSTIVVVKKDNLICMASETLTTFGTTVLNEEFQSNNEKILKWGKSLIGIVGSTAVEMIIRDVIDTKDEPDFSNQLNIFKFFTELHDELKDKYYLNPDEDDDDPVESSQFEIVIANKNGIFGVHSLRQVHEFKKFWAYGSGKRYALGAMNSIYNLKEFSATDIAKEGVKAGITFDDGSGGSIISHQIKIK